MIELKYVTCSGIKPSNNIRELINLGTRYPLAEFALQTNKLAQEQEKLEWFKSLVDAANGINVHLAMHINDDSCIKLCNGHVPDELKYLWNIHDTKSQKPIVGRVQINIAGVKQQFNFDANKVADVIHEYPDIKFIIQYTQAQHERILLLDRTGKPFDILQEYSGGTGKEAESWIPPVLDEHQMGYSGGLGPDNIIPNLNKINLILPKGYKTWVDAETKLHDPKTKEFKIALAEIYLVLATGWQNMYGCTK